MSGKRTADQIARKCEAKAAAIPRADQVLRTCRGCSKEFIAHRTSNSAWCCPCSVERRRAYERRLAGVSADPLPGFPREIAFATRSEIEAYLAPDKIECLLCGRKFKSLNTHLKRVHEMADLDAYRMKYGIPLSAGLAGRQTRDKLHVIGCEMWAKNGGPDLIEKMLVGAREFIASGKRAYQFASPAMTDERRVRMNRIWHLSPLSGPNADNSPTMTPCISCGVDVPVSVRVAVTQRCRKKCKLCLRESQNRASADWKKRHPLEFAEIQRRHRQKKAAG